MSHLRRSTVLNSDYLKRGYKPHWVASLTLPNEILVSIIGDSN